MSLEIISTIASGFAAASIANLIYPLIKTFVQKFKGKIAKEKGATITISFKDDKGIEKEIVLKTDPSKEIQLDELKIKEINKILGEVNDAQ